jgi:hypothetical protein
MKRIMISSDQDLPSNETPERNLWFAVIERALKDYCFFFDKLYSSGSGNLIPYETYDNDRKNQFNIKAIYEFNRLRWFIFTKDPEPFNLEYLAEQLYEDGEGAAASIRKEAKEQFKLHFDEADKKGRFQAVLYYIKENTGVERSVSATETSKLKYKRHRLI